ncbi:putative DNA-directed RNA polymerase II [Leptomonas pyrrhocoris]|uniref:Putative DNA-directed RNA polymerase II n=1 Tax=Leptomonas pyrrhocoris TaxID=157538 RepID=A0A0M9FY78_LEPPY|nr:putative DNA-directed RNA polymerase II [Leptomonas pyrrhocoris]KPA78560.1 putative DNA-directed RNA polymerase II [Leptomonas pyrrhocoris]|eukprot:XP_015656999.1 putative DNA-directed RNA polymerase II [Leptomonas pyrrhocoris]
MASMEELKVVRVFRALNTMIQLCRDRGYIIRHPSAIAEAVQDPALYDPEEGLDYDWFLHHFVVTPERADSMRAKKNSSSSGSGGGSGAENKKRRIVKEEQDEAEGTDLTEEAEILRRAANGEWICMRNAMRLSCSLAPGGAGSVPAPGVTKVPLTTAASVVKKEKEEDDGAMTAAEAAKAAKNALMVFFSGESKLTMKEVQACREKAMKKKASSIIMVVNRVEPGVRLDVQELSGRMDELTGEALLTIQIFEEEALAFNVVRHETVPHHAALSEADAQAFLDAHKLNISQLPRMLESDPLVQYLGLQRGSVVHITREGKQGRPYSMYRHVI